ncbi:hypothetical protein K438DRAFT_1970373 [Mycena galopus ATCC 62051]|nr:hypothetical protein K438DRAFT_1970373 [Mycena galopus ATCC 62051]
MATACACSGTHSDEFPAPAVDGRISSLDGYSDSHPYLAFPLLRTFIRVSDVSHSAVLYNDDEPCGLAVFPPIPTNIAVVKPPFRRVCDDCHEHIPAQSLRSLVPHAFHCDGLNLEDLAPPAPLSLRVCNVDISSSSGAPLVSTAVHSRTCNPPPSTPSISTAILLQLGHPVSHTVCRLQYS